MSGSGSQHKPAAKPASAPAKGPSTRKPEAVRRLFDEQAEEEQKKMTAKASLESIASAWDQYETDLIWEWCADCEGFVKKHGKKSRIDRDAIFRTIAAFPDMPHPKSTKALLDNWRHRNSTKYPGTGIRAKKDTHVSDEEEEEEEEDDDEESVSSSSGTEQPAKKKSKTSHPLAPNELADCVHCGAADQPKFCSDCGCCRDIAFDAEQNRFLRQRKAPAASSAAAAGTSTTDTSSTLTKRDKELERQRGAGADFPRFAKSVKCSAAEALALSAGAVAGPSYVFPSAALLGLIESGKLADIGYATPITIVDHAAGRIGGSHETSFDVSDAGGVKVSEKNIRAPPLTSMSQFMFTLVSVIIPALVERPAAVADWCVLARSALALESSRGTKSALDFIQRQLTHSVHRRTSFGAVDPGVMLSIVADVLSGGKHSEPPKLKPIERREPRDSSHRPPRAPRAPAAARSSEKISESCRQFNSASGCNYGDSCKYEHVCGKCKKAGHTRDRCRSGASSAASGPSGSPAAEGQQA